MAKADCMTDVLNSVHTGVLAVEALGTIGSLGDTGEFRDELATVLLYLGWKLKADIEALDGLLCRSGVLGKGVSHA